MNTPAPKPFQVAVPADAEATGYARRWQRVLDCVALKQPDRMPVALYPGMRICSFTFEQVSTPVSVPYYKKPSNKYAGQTKPLASRLVGEIKGS